MVIAKDKTAPVTNQEYAEQVARHLRDNNLALAWSTANMVNDDSPLQQKLLFAVFNACVPKNMELAVQIAFEITEDDYSFAVNDAIANACKNPVPEPKKERKKNLCCQLLKPCLIYQWIPKVRNY